MPTLNDLARDRTSLSPVEVEWLHLLVGDWQLLSDLSFADLVLWAPTVDGQWVALAHVRPTTGPMVFFDDLVGRVMPRGRRIQVDRAFDLSRICRERDPEWRDDVPVREETVPVVRQGKVIAVLGRHTNLAAARTPSRLELTYLRCADDLAQMVARGEFPVLGAPTGARRGAPRVGDGLIRLDADGVVTYASPNAVSAYHRIGMQGELVGTSLAAVTAGLLDPGSQVDESLPLVVTGRAPWRADLEVGGSSLSLRAIPLTDRGRRTGALVLLRDVSELRRRERELMSKDATIREIHHRVKNNLQTVAALLRLQARRLPEGEGRSSLEEAVRRVAAIALVHETLSAGFEETVDFDEVARRGVAMVAEVATAGQGVRTAMRGSFGLLRAEDATPLALVLTELVQNAVEHGLAASGGEVLVSAERSVDGSELVVRVIDDGVGLPQVPAGRDEPERGGLGMQIVQALVAELRGTVGWSVRKGGGTVAELVLRPRPLPDGR